MVSVRRGDVTEVTAAKEDVGGVVGREEGRRREAEMGGVD
jgi:hypothetical protein